MPNSPETLIAWLQLITGISFILGVLFLLLSVMFFRHSRRDAYWRQRRQAGTKGFRYSVFAVLLLVSSGALCLITLTVSYVEEQESVQADITPAESPSAEIVSDSPTPSPSPAQAEDDTPTPPPTVTAGDSVPPEPLPTTEPTAVSTPSPLPLNTSVEIQAVDDVISDDWQPIQPETTFTTSAQRLYVYFTYDNFASGDAWGQVLLKDGEILQKHSALWGITQTQGATFFFFGNQNGFEPGNYEVQITFGADEILLASTRFIILPE